MENVVKARGLGLAHLSEFDQLAELDQARIFADLAVAGCDALAFRPERWRLIDHDHVVLARAPDGRAIGLLGGCAGETGAEGFLHIETAFISAAFTSGAARELTLFERMLALAILRMEAADCAPAAVSVSTGSILCLAAMEAMAARLPGAVLFPQLDDVIALSTVSLARRIARQMLSRAQLNVATGCVVGRCDEVLAVLDLRGCEPETLLAVARDICRSRPSRAAWRQLLGDAGPVRRVAGH